MRPARLLALCLVTLPMPLAQGDAQDPANSINVKMAIRDGDGTYRTVVIQNQSGEPIIVTAIRLLECDNVQGGCTTRKMNLRVNPGGEVMAARIRARFEDRGFGFRASFSWTVDSPKPGATDPPVRLPTPQVAAERPSAASENPNPAVTAMIEKAIAADSSAEENVIDSVLVSPETGLLLRVGQSVSVAQALRIRAANRAGRQIVGARLRVGVEVGADVLRLDRGTLTGMSPGTAVVLVAPPLPETVSGGEPKGGSRIVVRVVP